MNLNIVIFMNHIFIFSQDDNSRYYTYIMHSLTNLVCVFWNWEMEWRRSPTNKQNIELFHVLLMQL